MKKALVSPQERSVGGQQRIAQVEGINPDPKSGGIPFPVAAPLEWIEVPDDTTVADGWDGNVVVKYAPPPPPAQATVAAFDARQRSSALDDLDRAIDSGATETALRLVRQLLQGK